jgi:hypothetical protein
MMDMTRAPSLIAAQEKHDRERASRRVVLRLNEAEVKKARRLKDRSETLAAFFRRLLAEKEE